MECAVLWNCILCLYFLPLFWSFHLSFLPIVPAAASPYIPDETDKLFVIDWRQ